MAKLLNVSIDLMKIDKTRIIEGKNGAKYINLTVSVNDQKDQYENDVSCWQGQTKEERKDNKDRNFLGNGRVVWSGDQTNKTPSPNQSESKDDGLYF